LKSFFLGNSEHFEPFYLIRNSPLAQNFAEHGVFQGVCLRLHPITPLPAVFHQKWTNIHNQLFSDIGTSDGLLGDQRFKV
jgi:hypothetical protein